MWLILQVLLGVIRFVSFLIFFRFNNYEIISAQSLDLLVVTVATDETDGFIRWRESVQRHSLPHLVIGMGQEWKGGDVAKGPGGAHKINMMKASLAEYGEREDLIILFTDAYDVVVTGSKDEILGRWRSMNAERDGKMRGDLIFMAFEFL